MKKVLFVAAMLLLCAGMQAQSSKSSQWVLKAGLNMMNFAGDGAEGTDANIGYDVMAGFQKSMGEGGAYWGMEFGIGTRGFKVDDLKAMAHAVEYSPFTFGWKFNVAENFKIDAHAGAYASFDFANTMKEDGESCSWGDFADAIEIDYNRIDAGLNVGVGVWYSRYNLDFTYQRGFISAFSDVDGFNTSNFKIRLGIAF